MPSRLAARVRSPNGPRRSSLDPNLARTRQDAVRLAARTSFVPRLTRGRRKTRAGRLPSLDVHAAGRRERSVHHSERCPSARPDHRSNRFLLSDRLAGSADQVRRLPRRLGARFEIPTRPAPSEIKDWKRNTSNYRRRIVMQSVSWLGFTHGEHEIEGNQAAAGSEGPANPRQVRVTPGSPTRHQTERNERGGPGGRGPNGVPGSVHTNGVRAARGSQPEPAGALPPDPPTKLHSCPHTPGASAEP